MKLFKLLKVLDPNTYIKVYDINGDNNEEIYLSPNKMVYYGYAGDIPVCWSDYKVRQVIPDFRKYQQDADKKITEPMNNIVIKHD